ncbi:MAG: 4Fe-4S dicluster domain-containing protein [Candidatus Aminicenantes bacterium]|nr:MAG: 4Fe-4S dicluster domain-containing protein [Candidatus Aminicenantes bacterium]
MAKVLMINHEKCTGCRLCELVCSVFHEGVSNPSRSRINIIKWEAEGLYIPMSCQQCEDAPCMTICPVKAISRDQALDYVKIDYNVCIGCRSCVAVCPFGAMGFNVIDKKVFKCDFCEGDPQCVRFCDVKAIEYVDANQLNIIKKREAAQKQSIAQKKAFDLKSRN